MLHSQRSGMYVFSLKGRASDFLNLLNLTSYDSLGSSQASGLPEKRRERNRKNALTFHYTFKKPDTKVTEVFYINRAFPLFMVRFGISLLGLIYFHAS